MIILPRQARDERSENSLKGCFLAEKRRAWLVGVSPVCGCEVRLLHAAGAKKHLFPCAVFALSRINECLPRQARDIRNLEKKDRFRRR